MIRRASAPDLRRHARDLVGEREVVQQLRRQVDRDRQLQARRVPGAALRERHLQHLLREAPDQAVLLRQRNEARRRDEAERRMMPARERFHAFDDPAVRRDARRLRLIVNLDLVRIERCFEHRRVDRRIRAQTLAQHQLQVREQDRLLQRAEHRQALSLADLLRGGEHALVHAACDQHLRLAAALAEIAQQLDAVGAGHLQVQHHDGRLKILHGPPELVRLRDRERLEAEAGRGLGNELAQIRLIVDHQQLVRLLRQRAPPDPARAGCAWPDPRCDTAW